MKKLVFALFALYSVSGFAGEQVLNCSPAINIYGSSQKAAFQVIFHSDATLSLAAPGLKTETFLAALTPYNSVIPATRTGFKLTQITYDRTNSGIQSALLTNEIGQSAQCSW